MFVFFCFSFQGAWTWRLNPGMIDVLHILACANFVFGQVTTGRLWNLDKMEGQERTALGRAVRCR